MLMNKLDVYISNTPLRKWILNSVTRKYYLEFFKELKGKTVLEIGCGNGVGAEIILKYFSPDKILATDLDPRMITLAKKNVQKREIAFEEADATRLSYKDKSFNAVFDNIAIHHIPSPEWKKCLSEIYRVLKPKGKVFLYDLSVESFNTIIGRLIKLLTFHPYQRMYKKEEFTNYLIKIGFKIIKEAKEPRHFVIVAEK